MIKRLIYVVGFIVCATGCVSLKNSERKAIDLTYSFDETTIYWPTEKGFLHQAEKFGMTDQGYFYSSYRFCAAEHGGTHIDAPIHFSERGQTLDKIPLSRLVGQGVVVDVSDKTQNNPDYLVSVQDLVDFEQAHNQSLNEKIVMLKTGWGRFWPNADNYLGTDKKGSEAVKLLHFPGLSKEAALWLTAQRNIKAVGIDTASIDYGQSADYGSHRALFSVNIPAFENVAHLDQLPPFGFDIVALPMKIKEGSGGPLRIIAILP